MNDGKIYLATGSSRSGKSVYIRHKIEKEGYEYLLVWDAKAEYGAQDDPNIPTTQKKLVSMLHTWEAANCPPVAMIYRYRDLKPDFDYFCDIAYYWIRRLAEQGKRGAVIVEESSDVCPPGKAPAKFGILIRRGLVFGSDIYVTSQRIAESDKTVPGNASVIHCCKQSFPDDEERMAKFLNVDVDQVKALVKDDVNGRFDYIERDLSLNKVIKGSLQKTGSDDKVKFEFGELF